MRYYLVGIFFILMSGLLTVESTFAQKNIQPGYIVNLSNDTVRGFIDYKNWDKNPDKIDFYTSAETAATEYQPVQLKSFAVSGETYVSAVVEMDDSPYRTEDLKEGIKYNIITDTVFLLTLVKGEKSLYYFMDNKAKVHFYIPGSKGFELLLFKQYLRRDEITGDLKVAKIVTFAGQLNLYLQDCSSIGTKLKLLKYERKSLVNLFQYYYDCTQKKMLTQNTAVSRTHEIGVLTGVSFTSLKYLSGMPYLTDADFPVSTNFSAGLFYNILFPRNFGRLSISNEVLYNSFLTECYYTDDNNTAVTTRIGLSYIIMHNMVQYKFPMAKADFFLKGGVSVGFGFNETNYQKFDETLSQRPSEGEAFNKMSKAYLGVNVGMGLDYKKFTLQGRYVLGFNKSDFTASYTAVNSRTNIGYILLGYEF